VHPQVREEEPVQPPAPTVHKSVQTRLPPQREQWDVHPPEQEEAAVPEVEGSRRK